MAVECYEVADPQYEPITVSAPKENESLTLLTPAPEEMLQSWLEEFYGKPVRITERAVLRHRDLSYVERLNVADGLPESIIYKLVLPPWDIEQDLHERILIPSISNSPQLFMSAHYGRLTALFLEDLGTVFFESACNLELAAKLGEDLAKMQRSYCYRTEELTQAGVLRTLFPSEYEKLGAKMVSLLQEWGLASPEQHRELQALCNMLAAKLGQERVSLVHGDLYAENIILRNDKMFIIDWSYFTTVGVPLLDLATLTMIHHKNGRLVEFREELIDAYCFESGRDNAEVRALLPYAELLSRLLFLWWLVERRGWGILGTTVGPVDELIPKIIAELLDRLAVIA
jgi:hypothetical protein